jgi:DNA-binding CsgD family transcriptional regulator
MLDQYVSTAGWDVSTRENNLGYIRRTIKPALGFLQVRKVRGPILDTLYARLMRCGNLACTSKPFTEHRNIPDLRPDPADRRLEWEQAADRVRAAIHSGQLPPGDPLPSVPDLARLQGLKLGTVRHAFPALARCWLAGRPAAELAAQPGARPLLEQITLLARRARFHVPPAATGQVGPALSFALAAQEIEMLRWVTDGLSNQQTAAELFISPRTASVHVSNILGKLGVACRTETAATA